MSFSLSTGFKKAHYDKSPESVVSLLSNTMTFTETEIVDAGKLGGFAAGDFVRVCLNLNDGIYAQVLSKTGSDVLTFAAGTFTAEVAGNYYFIEKINTGSFSSIMQNGVIDIMGSARPLNADTSAGAAVRLARITKGSGVFTSGVSVNGLNVRELNGAIVKGLDPATGIAEVWSGLGEVAGTAYWARWHSNDVVAGGSTTVARLDGDCNDNSGTDFFIDNRNIAVDKEVVVISVNLTLRDPVQ